MFMSLSCNGSALERCGLTERELVKLTAGPAKPSEEVDLVVLNGAATIIYVDREVERYLAMRSGNRPR